MVVSKSVEIVREIEVPNNTAINCYLRDPSYYKKTGGWLFDVLSAHFKSREACQDTLDKAILSRTQGPQYPKCYTPPSKDLAFLIGALSSMVFLGAAGLLATASLVGTPSGLFACFGAFIYSRDVLVTNGLNYDYERLSHLHKSEPNVNLKEYVKYTSIVKDLTDSEQDIFIQTVKNQDYQKEAAFKIHSEYSAVRKMRRENTSAVLLLLGGLSYLSIGFTPAAPIVAAVCAAAIAYLAISQIVDSCSPGRKSLAHAACSMFSAAERQERISSPALTQISRS